MMIALIILLLNQKVPTTIRKTWRWRKIPLCFQLHLLLLLILILDNEFNFINGCITLNRRKKVKLPLAFSVICAVLGLLYSTNVTVQLG
jgi:hypothetical protein